MFKVVSFYYEKKPVVEIVSSIEEASKLSSKRFNEGAYVAEYFKA